MIKPLLPFMFALHAVACVAQSTATATATATAPTAASSAAASEPMTLKERLSDKASDEQRVDNCKVPVDKRGTKLRPDTCPR